MVAAPVDFPAPFGPAMTKISGDDDIQLMYHSGGSPYSTAKDGGGGIGRFYSVVLQSESRDSLMAWMMAVEAFWMRSREAASVSLSPA